MLGGGEGAARRIRVLSDSVNELVPVLKAGAAALRSRQGNIVVDAQARAAILRVAAALETLNGQLAMVNQNIRRIGSNPFIMGALGGKTVEGELQSLVAKIDSGRSAIEEVIRLAQR